MSTLNQFVINGYHQIYHTHNTKTATLQCISKYYAIQAICSATATEYAEFDIKYYKIRSTECTEWTNREEQNNKICNHEINVDNANR